MPLFKEAPKARERPVLVGSREPAIADDIRHQNRRELAGLAHCAPPAVGRLVQMPARVCLNAGSFYAKAE